MLLSDIPQMQTYLETAQSALATGQTALAEALLAHARTLLPGMPTHPRTRDGLSLSTGIGLDPGLTRHAAPNEDYACAIQDTHRLFTGQEESFGLFIVADGMGGHAGGDEASRLAVHACVEYVLPYVRCFPDYGPDLLADVLMGGVQHANLAVFQQNQARGADVSGVTTATMGTTMTALLTVGTQAFVANVGDSRAYLSRQGRLFQLTEDHSTVAQLVKRGTLHPRDIPTHPKRNQIYRCLGAGPSVEVDVFPGHIQDGDTLLLCSDGLWEMVPDAALASLLARASTHPTEHLARELVHLAWQGGGVDNIGLVVVRASLPASAHPQIVLSAERHMALSAL